MFSSACVAGRSIQPVPPQIWYLVTAEWIYIPMSVAAQEDTVNRHLASLVEGKFGAVSKHKSASSQHQCTDSGRAAREPLVDCAWSYTRCYWNYDNLCFIFLKCAMCYQTTSQNSWYISLWTPKSLICTFFQKMHCNRKEPWKSLLWSKYVKVFQLVWNWASSIFNSEEI